MSDTAPPVVTRYLAAADARDAEGLAECFTPDGAAIDEGRTYRGREQIIGWRTALAEQWTFTRTITGSEPIDAVNYRVRVHVEGNFPGGVADLTYRFSLSGDQIAELSIVE